MYRGEGGEDSGERREREDRDDIVKRRGATPVRGTSKTLTVDWLQPTLSSSVTVQCSVKVRFSQGFI